jgi:hypothetical protein
VTRQPSPPTARHPVLIDLAGLCFNCLWPNHIVALCSNVACCLCCHCEGHQAHSCKRMHSPDSTIDQAEAALASVLMAVVGGTRPAVSLS